MQNEPLTWVFNWVVLSEQFLYLECLHTIYCAVSVRGAVVALVAEQSLIRSATPKEYFLMITAIEFHVLARVE